MGNRDFAQMLADMIRDRMRDIVIAIPGTVQSYDPSREVVTVQPALMSEDATGAYQPYGVLSDVPVAQPSGGGFFIRIPLRSGDTGMIEFPAYDMDQFIQSGGMDMESEQFNQGNALFRPGIRSFTKPAVPGVPAKTGLLLGSEDMQFYLHCSDAGFWEFVFDETNSTKIYAGGVEVTLGGVTYNLATHLHSSGAPGSPTSPPTAGT